MSAYENERVPEYRAVVREVTGRMTPCWVPYGPMPTLMDWLSGALYLLSHIHRGVAVYDRLYGPIYVPPPIAYPDRNRA